MNREEKLDRIAEGVSESIQRLLETAESVNGGVEPEGEWWDRARDLAVAPVPDNSGGEVRSIPADWWLRLAASLDRRLRHSSQVGVAVGAVLALMLIAPLAFM